MPPFLKGFVMAKLICERCEAEIDPAIGTCSLCDGQPKGLVKEATPKSVETEKPKKKKK